MSIRPSLCSYLVAKNCLLGPKEVPLDIGLVTRVHRTLIDKWKDVTHGGSRAPQLTYVIALIFICDQLEDDPSVANMYR